MKHTIKKGPSDEKGLTIEELEEFVKAAKLYGGATGLKPRVNVSWLGRIKSIWVEINSLDIEDYSE